jgi:AcrR family transcriptional regulator
MMRPSTAKRIKSKGQRRYNNVLRRAQATETRARILAAGTNLAHGAKSWDWREITFRAVAERAGISERTIYRHFSTEKQLHDGVMMRLEQDAGVSYEGMSLVDVINITARVFSGFSSFAVAPPIAADSTFRETDERRHQALVRAISAERTTWPDHEVRKAAAVLDLLWSPMSYERLMTGWGLEGKDAARAIIWALETLTGAISEGNRPSAKQSRASKGGKSRT